MSKEERKKFEGLHSRFNKYWIPCVWFTNLAAVARCEGRVRDDHTLKLLLEVHTHKQTRDRNVLISDFWCCCSLVLYGSCSFSGAERVQGKVQHVVSL